MADYSRQRATAERLIKKQGKPVTLQRTIKGPYDPSTGGSVSTTQNIQGFGVFVRFTNSEIDGTTILSSDRKLIYSGEEIRKGDKYGAERLESVSPLDPDESGAILYIGQLRK